MTNDIVRGNAQFQPRLGAWPLWALGVVAVVATWLTAPASPALRYERVDILDGEWWRLLSGHVVHLGQSHLLLNLAGLALIGWVFGPGLRAAQWLVLLAGSWLALSAGFLLLEPQLAWYVGLSGLLHGLLLGALPLDRGLDWRVRLLMAILIGAKLVWEQWAGELPLTASAAGGPVVVEAHLYGGIGGLLAGIAWWSFRRWRPV